MCRGLDEGGSLLAASVSTCILSSLSSRLSTVGDGGERSMADSWLASESSMCLVRIFLLSLVLVAPTLPVVTVDRSGRYLECL